MNKVANRSRRLASKLREILLGVKNHEAQIIAVESNEELGVEEKEALVARIRQQVALNQQAANRLSARKQQLAYEDPDSNTPRPAAPRCFFTHTEVLTDDRKWHWTRISRKEALAARAFFSVQEAYAAK